MPPHMMGTTQMPSWSHASPHPGTKGSSMHSKLAGHGFGVARSPPQASYELVLAGRSEIVRVTARRDVIVERSAGDADDAEDIDDAEVAEDSEDAGDAGEAEDKVDEEAGCVMEMSVVGTVSGIEREDVVTGSAEVAAARVDAPRTARILETSIANC
ncbi:hypothetical protein CSHISOI_08812 [Colletotrichum shisoi]|uniref:Uncharacterized protein n=1 Tax=Colletotrichum shisoi TaxID=2078593 RepID=A0A5Q4BI60_9PEZI|nr:hypothetical protein CSHISOI_08812 [Colletotrichum shisoi]